MAKKKIEPNIILNVYTHCYNKVIFIITDISNTILYMDSFDYIPRYETSYVIRRKVINKCNTLITQFNIDTIIMEQTKLFTDGITKYPDPVVYHNILYSYGIQISVEDKFKESVQYILVIPHKDWTQTILNTKNKYPIDLYKNHILLNYFINNEQLEQIATNNYYQALCFSESTQYKSLLDKKYLIE